MTPQPNLASSEIKKAVENLSGYPYELEIVKRIEQYKKYGFWVEPNYSFEDHDTGEARELDFHASQAETISIDKSEFVFTVLLGSCKDNNNPYVFFTRNIPFPGITLNSDIPIAGCPLEIYTEPNDVNEAIEWYFRLHDFLHIAQMDVVSSQFCELVWKNNKWTVQSEPIFKNTFIPMIKAMSREIEDYNKNCVPEKGDLSPDYQIYYPVIVIRGPMFEYYVPPTGNKRIRKAKHILFIRHYESRNVKCHYAIDIIHDSYLEEYLNLTEKELVKFTNLVKRHKKSITRSIEKIIEIEENKKKK